MSALQILNGDGTEEVTVQRRYAERVRVAVLEQSKGLLEPDPKITKGTRLNSLLRQAPQTSDTVVPVEEALAAVSFGAFRYDHPPFLRHHEEQQAVHQSQKLAMKFGSSQRVCLDSVPKSFIVRRCWRTPWAAMRKREGFNGLVRDAIVPIPTEDVVSSAPEACSCALISKSSPTQAELFNLGSTGRRTAVSHHLCSHFASFSTGTPSWREISGKGTPLACSSIAAFLC